MPAASIRTRGTRECKGSLAQTRLAAEPKKRQLPPLTSPANPEEHVFIPLEGYGQKIEDLFEEQEFVFVRGGVAVGKSTMAIHLARQFPETGLFAFPSPALHKRHGLQTSMRQSVAQQELQNCKRHRLYFACKLLSS